MLEYFGDERVYVLVEWQINTDTHAAFARLGSSQPNSLIGRLHQSWPSARNDATAHDSQFFREITNRTINPVIPRDSRGAKDRDSELESSGRPEPRQIVDDLPKPLYRFRQYVQNLLFPA
jgi:hypothetical protein